MNFRVVRGRSRWIKLSGSPEAQAVSVFYNSINKYLQGSILSYIIIYDEEARGKIHEVCEAAKVLFNVLERSNIMPAMKMILFSSSFCLKIHCQS